MNIKCLRDTSIVCAVAFLLCGIAAYFLSIPLEEKRAIVVSAGLWCACLFCLAAAIYFDKRYVVSMIVVDNMDSEATPHELGGHQHDPELSDVPLTTPSKGDGKSVTFIDV